MRKLWYNAYSAARRLLKYPRQVGHEHWHRQDYYIGIINSFPNTSIVFDAIKTRKLLN